jgi:hypothetical protein
MDMIASSASLIMRVWDGESVNRMYLVYRWEVSADRLSMYTSVEGVLYAHISVFSIENSLRQKSELPLVVGRK